MLEKLITNLKNSLPEPLRKKLGGGDENQEEEAEASPENDLQKYESDDAPAEGAEDKKKKQISMIIRVLVICGIAYFAIDEFVLKKSTEPTPEELMAAAAAKPRKSKKKIAEEAAAQEEIKKAKAAKEAKEAEAANTPAVASTDASTMEVPPDATATNTPPIENVNILNKTTSTTPETQLQIEPPISQEVVESKIIDTSVDKKIDQLVDNVDQSTGTAETINIPSQPQSSPEKMAATNKEAPSNEDSMASKIVENATETPPPVYDHLGRGLVYNCKDKFWACLDKPAYVMCNKNMKWNKSQGNAAECVVQDIYSSDEDCSKIQKYNVTMSVSTAFCN